jgi:hypothetical protein
MGVRQRLASLFRSKPADKTARAASRTEDKQEFAVIGLGVFGRSLAQRLSELGFTVLGIDSDAAVVQALADDLSSALVLDATNEALRQADIGRTRRRSSPSATTTSSHGAHDNHPGQIGVPQIIAWPAPSAKPRSRRDRRHPGPQPCAGERRRSGRRPHRSRRRRMVDLAGPSDRPGSPTGGS